MLVAGLVTVPAGRADAAVSDPASLVNPLLGTSNGGNTFPGAVVPFGMVQWSPDTPSRPAGGNYAYSDNTITGFSLNHLSGPGCNATADVPILPTVGAVNGSATSSFSHADESATAGAYTVTLGNGVTTELTTTTRTGMARFTFPQTNQANLLFKLGSAGTRTDAQSFTRVSSTEIRGWITSGHFCADSPTYTLRFSMVFDRPMTSDGTFSGGNSVTFDASSNRVVTAKVGVSFVSDANAAANRAAEIPGWDFAATRQAAHTAWNAKLGRIAVTGGTGDQQKIFYTALYHALLHPNVYSDVNGQYTGFDRQTHTVSGAQRAQYATFSGWDIYRSQAQLHALVDPQSASDAAQSLLNDYQQNGGFLPKWTLNHADTDVMNGDPSPIVIADYHAFGARAFDTTAAKNAMVAQGTAQNKVRKGNRYIDTIGYLPTDGTYESGFYGPTATTLEYATSDFAIGAMAGRLGDTANQTTFVNRAQSWRNVFNPATGFVQGKQLNGQWRPGFDPKKSTDMVEGTSWQYTGMVPFNLRGLADAKGGNAAMVSYLDSVLSSLHGQSNDSDKADMGNEPSMNLPWAYDYVGQPWKTQQKVRQVQNELWNTSPANWGVGNDDLGTMSAWYVFAALGFYPNTPGTADLALGSPLFTEVSIALGGGGTIRITAPQAATGAPYVQSATLNGSAWNNAYLPASFVTGGGTLAFTLGTSANTSWATGAAAAPPSYPGTAGTGTVTAPLRGQESGRCVDVPGYRQDNGTRPALWDCNAGTNQSWTATTGQQLTVYGTKCLEVNAHGTTDGDIVQIWDCTGGANQQWTVRADGTIVGVESGRCLDATGHGTTNGTVLAIWTCNGGTNQKWTH
ncbi:alpha-1,2-mannosidase [Actinoplanes palleronii]|uniref:Alpha-1,2-mannosidase n=1 Tax=Actinoplanes palleronii TaxID=113570 RepID=A0ABQ4BH06_9ACTN|nr:alpha-1,2-mannosidase [Actinoplanes palleronii]